MMDAILAQLQRILELPRWDFESAYDGSSSYGDMVAAKDGQYVDFDDLKILVEELQKTLAEHPAA